MLSYDPNQNIQEIVLVGCGGTGGQVARTIARIIRMMLDSGKSAPRLRFVDPDIIETKNIGRQLFQCGFHRNCRKNRDSILSVEKVNEVTSKNPL